MKLLPTVRLTDVAVALTGAFLVVKIISFKIIDNLWSHFLERKTQITTEGGNFYRVGPGFRRGAYHISR